MKALIAVLLLLALTIGYAVSRPRFLACDPYAEKCLACKDCTACYQCSKVRNECSVCRAKKK